jgi:hypothetical protein
MNSASPSFMLIELTTALPCTAFRPVSRTDHLLLSIITGTAAMSFSPAMSRRNLVITASLSSRPSSMLTSITLAPPSTCWRATSIASSYFSALMRLANFLEPVTLVRSPTIRKLLSGRSVIGSVPLRRSQGTAFTRLCGLSFASRREIAAMCAGVVPQQPPRIFTQPLSAYSPTMRAIASGPRSNRPISFGSPALGWQLMRTGATCDSASMCGRITSGPSAQFMPTESMGKCEIAFQNASIDCPETNVAPPLSKVPDTITGTRAPVSSK